MYVGTSDDLYRKGGEYMFDDAWGIITAGWSMITGIIDPYVNVEVFVASLIVLVISSVVLSKVDNFLLDILALVFVASSVYFLLASVDIVPEGLAFAVGVLALAAGLWRSWGDAESKLMKAFAVVLLAGVAAALLGVASTELPNIDIGPEITQVIDRTGDFFGRTADAAQDGAEIVNK